MSDFILVLFASQSGRKLKGKTKVLITGSCQGQIPSSILPWGEIRNGQQPRGTRYLSVIADLLLHPSMTHVKVYREQSSQEPFTGGTPAFLGQTDFR